MGNLLYWAAVFLVVALVAAVLGFGGVAGVAMEGARLLFWVAIVQFIVALVGGLMRRGGVLRASHGEPAAGMHALPALRRIGPQIKA
jgi:uncharacterized membrane protein YtjA (UPF0391 family)